MNRLWGAVCALVFALGVVAPAYAGDFRGFYVGVNAGGATGDFDARTTTVFSPTGYFASSSVPAIATAGKQHLSPTGFAGGGQAGYNFQHKVLVFGFEADFGGMRISDKKSTTAPYPCCPTTSFTVTQFVGTDWLFTLRP